MKKFSVIILLLLSVTGLKAQDPFFILHRQNSLWFNPASAGWEGKRELSLSGRSQTGNFNSLLLSYQQPLNKLNSGIGAAAFYDYGILNPLKTFQGGLSYNYKIRLGSKSYLALGLEAAFIHQSMDLYFTNQYTINPATHLSYNHIDLNIGTWLKLSDLYAGASVKHFISQGISDLVPAEHYYNNIILTGGYNWKLSRHFSMIPSVLLMSQGPRSLLQINNDLVLNNTYMLGAGFRPGTDMVMANAGVTLKKKLQLMVACDLAASGLVPANQYSHSLEANVKYGF